MEFRYLLRILQAHWKFVTISATAAFVAGLAATYVLSEKYEASTKILIRPSEEVNLAPTHKAMMDYPVSINIPAEAMSETYAEVMTSEALATRVVDELQLHTLVAKPDPRWYVRAYEGLKDLGKISIKYTWDFVRYGRVESREPREQAIQDVLERLEAEPIGNTYLFELTATWDSPKIAALIADTAANIFVQYNLEASRSEDGTSAEFLGERAQSVRAALEEGRLRLEETSQRAGAAQLDYQLSLKLTDLADFEEAYQQTRKDLQEVDAEIATLEEQLSSQAEDRSASRVMTKNPVVLALEEEIARWEAELAGLSETHQAAHPDVKTLAAKIDEAKRRIATENVQIPYQETSATNPIHEAITSKLLDREASRALLVSRQHALENTIREYRAESNRLYQEQNELDALSLEVSVMENEYRAVRQEYGEARLAAAQEISEIRILHPAIVPLYPTGPIKLYYAGGALILGFLGALTYLLIRDYTQPRVVTTTDVESVLDAPVIVMVPRGELPSGATLLLGDKASSASATWQVLAKSASGQRGTKARR